VASRAPLLHSTTISRPAAINQSSSSFFVLPNPQLVAFIDLQQREIPEPTGSKVSTSRSFSTFPLCWSTLLVDFPCQSELSSWPWRLKSRAESAASVSPYPHLPNKLEATKQALGHCALRTGQPELNQAHLSLITWSRPTTNPFLLFSYLPKPTTLIRP
jgi:hypothetical protein